MKSDRGLTVSNVQIRRAEVEFLPAALEVVETPASPAGRAIAGCIILVFCFAIAWSSLGKLDIIVSAPGRIIPVGGTKVIQPYEIGIVSAINVQDGQHVNTGDILIELDHRINESERDHFVADLTASQLEIARLKAALASADSDSVAELIPPAGVKPSQVAMQLEYLVKQVAEHRAKIASLDRQSDQKKAEKDTIRSTIQKLSTVIPIIQQRVDIRKISSDREYTSKFQFFEMQQLLVEQQQDLMVQESRLREAEANIAALTETRSQAIQEYSRALYGQLVEAERKADGLYQDVSRIQQKVNAQYLRTPIDGTVQQLAVHTLGGVVTPAQPLLSVVPLESHLEIEATVPNKDIGFVRTKQQVEIKVDAFNFTKYGLLHGEVTSVSRDAISRQKPVDKETNSASDSTSSEPSGQEWGFAARVSLDRSQMQIEGEQVNLTPGMAVTIEIKTGSRRVISYLLSPIIRYGHESLKER